MNLKTLTAKIDPTSITASDAELRLAASFADQGTKVRICFPTRADLDALKHRLPQVHSRISRIES